MTDWDRFRSRFDVAEYDRRWEQLEASGHNSHGEADLVASYHPVAVLDAGCGTGRVAVELHRRGISVVGVDLDADMLTAARSKAPDLAWVHADLSRLELQGGFDVAVMAGNVMRFVAADRRADAVSGCARHLTAGGRLIAGWQLGGTGPSLADYDDWCTAAGLSLEDRFATWERAPYVDASDYAVSIHRARIAPGQPGRAG